jgi:hypothetical protein
MCRGRAKSDEIGPDQTQRQILNDFYARACARGAGLRARVRARGACLVAAVATPLLSLPSHGAARQRVQPAAHSVEPVRWAADDHAAALATFLTSCRPLLRTSRAVGETRPMYFALMQVCRRALDNSKCQMAIKRHPPPCLDYDPVATGFRSGSRDEPPHMRAALLAHGRDQLRDKPNCEPPRRLPLGSEHDGRPIGQNSGIPLTWPSRSRRSSAEA